jgi:hypothetical protein
MIDPLPPDSDLSTVIAKLDELIGAFNERGAAMDSLPLGMRRRVDQAMSEGMRPITTTRPGA